MQGPLIESPVSCTYRKGQMLKVHTFQHSTSPTFIYVRPLQTISIGSKEKEKKRQQCNCTTPCWFPMIKQLLWASHFNFLLQVECHVFLYERAGSVGQHGLRLWRGWWRSILVRAASANGVEWIRDDDYEHAILRLMCFTITCATTHFTAADMLFCASEPNSVIRTTWKCMPICDVSFTLCTRCRHVRWGPKG